MMQAHEDLVEERRGKSPQYDNLQQDDVDGEPHFNLQTNNFEEENYGVEESQSPNPFYNPQMHHEIEQAQQQHEQHQFKSQMK